MKNGVFAAATFDKIKTGVVYFGLFETFRETSVVFCMYIFSLM